MKSSLSLVQVSQRFIHPHYAPKSKYYFKPTYFDNPTRSWDDWKKNWSGPKYNTQDPLFLDHKQEQVTGGIELLVEHIHHKQNYRLPLKNMAYVIYNMAYKGVYDPKIYEKFEGNYATASDKHMTARIAYGGLWAYYKSNQGTAFGIDFWESKLEDNMGDMKAQWVLPLLEAFKDNRKLHRDHIREKLDSQFKKVILDNWMNEVEYHQRLLVGLARELNTLRWYDPEVWDKIFTTAVRKSKIQNLYFFMELHQIMVALNTDKDSPFFNTLGEKIETFVAKHHTTDRQWRYDAENQHLKTVKELVARREEATMDKFLQRKAETDATLIEMARQAERRLKRLRMAKYSEDLFDEIVSEMMREHRTIMEMMAELDVEDQDIYDSQTRIAKRQQQKKIEDMQKKGELVLPS